MLLLSMLINTGNLQAQNDVNLLPDTGNVGIGTANPAEKLEVTGNSILDGNVAVSDSMQVGGSMEVQQSLSVTDSLSVGSNVSIGSSLRIIDSLTVGSKVIVNQSMYVSDTLSIGSTLKVNEIKDVQKISTTSLKTNTITGEDGVITIFDPLGSAECDALVIDYCNRTIFGHTRLSSGVDKYYGVSIGRNARTANEYSFSAGNGPWAVGHSSIALGTRSRAITDKSIVIGSAADGTEFFNNSTPNSLMVGFNISNSKPSLFVGPSTISGIPGNVGISTTTPADKLVIGEGMERISFGSAMNSDAGYMTGYIGINSARNRTDMWQSSTWTIASDGGNNGAGIIVSDAGGKMYLIPLRSIGKAGYSLTDAEIIERHVVEIEGRENAGAGSTNIGNGIMKVNGKIYCKEIEVKMDPASKPSFFVGPSTLSGIPGNVGISTKTPTDKLVIGEGIERISFGSAFNDEAGWKTGYIGMNISRVRTDKWQSSIWSVASEGNNGGAVISTNIGGQLEFIPVAGTGNQNMRMTDEELNLRKVVIISGRPLTANGLGDGVMHVNGKIYCKEIEVKIDPAFWWDDVFAPGYQLRTFEELQAYIALNGHLPDVPSETEVTENGLSLGESYGTLLRKIEELTLYMLQLKKENEELRKLIEEK